MAEISASLVKELRELTGLGMMECKKALAEAGGDIGKAEELLRIKSGAKASKAAGRIAAEGIVASHVTADGRIGALVEVNCETDFVARNEELLAFGASLAGMVAADAPADVSALGASVEERRQALVQKIGENISIRRFERMQARGRIASYLHGTKIGVLVDYEGPDEVGKDLALHVAFARPRYMNRTEVPADVVERERAILTARANESGKPAEIVAKMVEGGLNKFTGEISLLGQPFVKDDKQTVEKMLAASKAKLHAFRFIVVGEGIEKKASDFAAEVASMVKAS
ncbi:MAG: translation elongation factor Ts [Bradyrhizobium sp.]|uniref:translation elongation factor Ts n=1 Tax=Bradyrhizobium sp. TaxID=376 RepID=UPI003D11513D